MLQFEKREKTFREGILKYEAVETLIEKYEKKVNRLENQVEKLQKEVKVDRGKCEKLIKVNKLLMRAKGVEQKKTIEEGILGIANPANVRRFSVSFV